METENYKYNAEHAAGLDGEVVRFKTVADSSSATKAASYVNYTVFEAITQYVSKATELKQFDLETVKAGQSLASTDFSNNFNRLCMFMLYNGNAMLMQYLLNAIVWFMDEFNTKITSDYGSFELLLIIDPIVIVVLMGMFVPFILRVQSSLFRVYMHMCKFREEEVRGWLETCKNSADIIGGSAFQARKAYGSTTFDITLIKDGEENAGPAEEKKEAPKETLVPTVGPTEKGNSTFATTGAVQTDDVLLQQTDEERMRLTEILKSKQTELTERRQKGFSRVTREKTKSYMVLLSFFMAFIGIFRVVDVLVFNNIKAETEVAEGIFLVLIMREVNAIRAMQFFREELVINYPMALFGSMCFTANTAIADDIVAYMVEGSISSELSYARYRSKLTGSMSILQTYLHDLDYNRLCETFYLNDADTLNSTDIIVHNAS